MPIVSSQELFQKAYGSYAIGAFNVNNMEIIQGVMSALYEAKSPAILQVSLGARKYAGSSYIKHLVKAANEEYPDIPIVLHLDHGEDFEICKTCIDEGFNSVMIDASKHSFSDNVKITKQVVEYAHSKGVVVEAELGRLGGVEEHVSVSEKDAIFTHPEEAAEFVKLTNCDSLAIAIGTSHGAYKFKGEAYLDLERLKKITKLLPPKYPLVLHGASTVLPFYVQKINEFGGKLGGAKGVPESMILESTKLGICKVNIDTDIRLAFTAAIRESLITNPEEFDPRFYLKKARTAVKDMVLHKVQNVLGSANKV